MPFMDTAQSLCGFAFSKCFSKSNKTKKKQTRKLFASYSINQYNPHSTAMSARKVESCVKASRQLFHQIFWNHSCFTDCPYVCVCMFSLSSSSFSKLLLHLLLPQRLFSNPAIQHSPWSAACYCYNSEDGLGCVKTINKIRREKNITIIKGQYST